MFRDLEGTAEAVMLGDPLTESGPRSELLRGVTVLNRGIVGDTSAHVLRRVDEVAARRPKAVFLLVGVNDLWRGVPVDATASNVEGIVARLQGSGAVVVVQSVVHVGTGQANVRNDGVAVLSRALAEVAARRGATFLDLNASLAPDGELPSDLTYDGLHLAGAAYRAWGATVREHLVRLPGLPRSTGEAG